MSLSDQDASTGRDSCMLVVMKMLPDAEIIYPARAVLINRPGLGKTQFFSSRCPRTETSEMSARVEWLGKASYLICAHTV